MTKSSLACLLRNWEEQMAEGRGTMGKTKRLSYKEHYPSPRDAQSFWCWRLFRLCEKCILRIAWILHRAGREPTWWYISMLSYSIMITRFNSLSTRDFSLTATWYLLKTFRRYYLEELHSLEVNANQQLLRKNGLKGGTEAPTSNCLVSCLWATPLTMPPVFQSNTVTYQRPFYSRFRKWDIAVSF